LPNDVKLQEGHPVDENLRPIKVGGKSTAIETAQHGNGARVNGDLEVTGDITGNIKDMVLEDVTLDSLTTSSIVSTDLTIDDSGDITLDADGGEIILKNGGTTFGQFSTALSQSKLRLYEAAGVSTDDYCSISVAAEGATIISTNDASGTDADLTLISDGDLIMHSISGNFIAKTGAGITEFSAANSAYAGMILGYTDIGLDEAEATYNLTTGYVVPTDEFSVSFIAPPSGNVEIEIQITVDVGSSNAGDLSAGLSTANATSGYSALADYHETYLFDGMSRGALRNIKHSWTLKGLTAGTAYEYWAGFKSGSTLGTPHLQWGGDASGKSSDFIMKATALPATIGT